MVHSKQKQSGVRLRETNWFPQSPTIVSRIANIIILVQVKVAQLRTGVSNSMGWYQRLVDGGFHAGHNRRCRWCGLSDETVTHVYNECEELQLRGLRHDISTATGRVLNAACLVTDPASALEYHDRAIGFLQRRGGIVA